MTRSTTLAMTLLLASLLLIAVFAVILTAKVRAADSTTGADGRLVTIHDRGVEKVILTKADTVSAAIQEAGLSLDATDTVEPSRDEKLVARDYQINIYRARPIIVTDGSARVKVMTAYQSSAEIAKVAGMPLHDQDTTTMSPVHDIVSEGAGLELKITRATPLTLVLYGAKTAVRTQTRTVGEFLQSKHITLAADDTLSAATSSPIKKDMTIEIWRNGKQTVNEEQAVDFPVQQIKDADRELGYKEVKTPGEKGSRTVTYEVEMKNGQEVGRTEIQSVVTKEPKQQIEVVGAKLPTPTNPSEAQALGHQMMLAAGFGDDQWPCLYNLWMRESGWKTTAGNPSSGAYGIPQALPGSKMGPGWQTDAAAQISWGLGYIRGRYQTPCGAWDAFNSRSPHWY